MKTHVLRIPNKAQFDSRLDFNIDGIDYAFVLYTYENKNGFVHFSRFFVDWETVGDNKVQYYNRTWERYIGQMAFLGSLEYALESKDIDKETYTKLFELVKNF